ncbi:FAA hydrolase family protein [Rathayibacter sp. VKM Ac-2803]|uniref:fumarylacetoacetate hydrolase family protein n=1 Tax=unclassified Rathayibacter TaxID=2609250 RepID=UPI0013567BAE|nr:MULTISPECIES: fumarylacetoacetate hydrolase family protein [unclassified Rathayibacter]MWV48286.1 FAA hydrolase family protein [Rathayibacter sp. VKM Ac-2803]MWV59221.1 FAA hydrolase family protein [Rathayibacter sp. VKM Ac-2754]
MQYVIPPPARTTVALAESSELWPVRRVFCVGRNYAEHTREMGGDPEREAPFFFMKPADAVVEAGGDIPYPPLTGDLHHEIELVVAIGTAAVDVSVTEAARTVFGYAVGIDLTRRDLQAEAKKHGRPWEWGKAFDRSAPVGAIRRRDDVLEAGGIWLDVNGERRQTGDLGDMIWSIPEIVSALSRSVALRPGDLVFTGTPAGVGPIQRGDRLEAGVDGVGEISLRIV